MDTPFFYSLLLDCDAKIIYFSYNHLTLTKNIDDRVLTGMPALDAFKLLADNDFVRNASHRLSRIMSGENDLCEDDILVSSTGEKHICRTTYRRITNENNDFDGTLIFSHDITSIRLEEMERRLHDLLYSTTLPCQIWNESGDVIAYNKEAIRVFGIPEGFTSEEYGQFFLSKIQPKYQPDGTETESIKQKAIREALKTGFAYASVQLNNVDGTPIYFTANAARISWMFDYRLVIYFYDKTSIIIKEEKAKEAEEHEKLMFDTTPLGCCLWNKDLTIINCNKELLKMLAIPNKQVFLDDFCRFSPKHQPDGQLSSIKAIEYLKEGFKKGHLIFEWIHQDFYGKPVPTEITLICIKGANDLIMASHTRDLREYKKMMEKVDGANNRIRLMLDSMPLIATIIDKDFKMIDCNQATINLFEISSKQEYIDRFYDLSPQYQPCGRLSKEMFIEAVSKAITEGYNRIEWMHQKLNGEPIPCEVTLIRENDSLVMGYARDLREVRAALAEANEANERTKLMLDSMPLTATFINKDFEIIDCNQEAINLFEVSNKNEYMNRFYDLSPQYQPCGRPSKEMSTEILSKAISEGYNHAEWMHQKLNGELIPCEITLICKDKSSIVGYARDLREVKAALAEANEANERTKLMLDINPLVCVMRDEQGNIIDCNQEALNVSGASDKTEFCKNFYNYFIEYQKNGPRNTERKRVLQLVDEKGSISIERTIQTPAGELIPVESKIVRIPWKSTHRYISFSRDLREEIAKEHKLLEIMERERKAEHQREAAQAATEAKGRFLASMSHEIRTPMNAIVGMSELLLQEELSKRQLRYAKDIKTSAMALLDIINDILDVSKIQEGKLSLVPVHYDFNTMIDAVESIAQFLVESKSLTFKLIMQDKTPKYLYGDDIRLRQVLLNLLSNAIKFTEKGHVHLIVSPTDTSIHFTVTDTGMGIRPEDISRLFVAFEQLDTLKNRGKRGTGLGLAISKSLIEMMGGRISVESVYGQGSSFHIEIPKVLGDETQSQHAEDKEIQIYAPDAKVLVVDDNKMNLNVASGLLRLYQITAETTTSGRQAIELIKKSHYDIVFMDHMMPEMTGIEATKIIRELGISVIIIALTASAVIGAKERMLDAGMNDYLPKPIINAELKHMLNKWLPREKFSNLPLEKILSSQVKDEKHEKFWDRIEQIEELSLSTGLDRVGGQWDAYETTLRLMIKEIEKCDKNLNEFLLAHDMRNFCIEVHSMKSSLANIGAMELSAIARELEIASDGSDAAFCALNLPSLLDGLGSLYLNLKDAFSKINQNGGLVEIPSELPPILNKIINAFDEIDLVLIDEEMKKLNALNLGGALKEKIEQINDAVMMMDYDGATEQIHNLLN